MQLHKRPILFVFSIKLLIPIKLLFYCLRSKETVSSRISGHRWAYCAHAGQNNTVEEPIIVIQLYCFKPPHRARLWIMSIQTLLQPTRQPPSPTWDQSDHRSLFLTPKYTPLINRVKPSVKTINVWPVRVEAVLQNRFNDMN